MNPSKVIQRKADQFLRRYAIWVLIEALDQLDTSLNEINSDNDQYCYFTLIKKSIPQGMSKHEGVCSKKEHPIEVINDDFVDNLDNRINQISRFFR